MTHKDNENMRLNEGRRAVNHLQEQSHFDQFMEDDSTDMIVIMKDSKNQSVTMKKVQRCKVCLKIPDSNCLCKQKGASLRSNMSAVSQMSHCSDVSYGGAGQKVNRLANVQYVCM